MKKAFKANSMIHATFVVSASRTRRMHRIVSWGVNHIAEGGRSIHSEVDALRGLRRGRERLILLNARISRTGVVNMSRPCPNCARWISCRPHIIRICWTDHDHTIKSCAGLNQRRSATT